jgi:hypothetical protein
MRSAVDILVGKLEGKRSLKRPTHRWKDNIRMDLREMGVCRCELDSSGSW